MENSISSLLENNPAKMLALKTVRPMTGGKPHMPNLLSELNVLKLIFVREQYLKLLSELVCDIESTYENYYLQKRSLEKKLKTQSRIKKLTLLVSVG